MRTKLILIFSIGLLLAAGVLTGAKDSGGGSMAVSIRDGFSPARVSIKVGQTVVWTNNDQRDHDVTAEDGSFGSGNLKSGQSYSHTFTAVGTFAYGCSLHPRERGTVAAGK